jgi:hypothetical protein
MLRPLSPDTAARPRSPVRCPVGFGGGASPSPIPVGSRKRSRSPAAASLADPARPKPCRLQARIGAEAPQVALPGNAGPKPSRFPRNFARREPLEIPFRIAAPPEGLAALPDPFRGRSLVGNPSGRGFGPKPWPFPCRLEPRGDSHGLRRSADPPRSEEPFVPAVGGFVKSRLASACADRCAASSASRPSASGASVLGGATATSDWGLRSWLGDPFPVRRASGHNRKLSA